MLAVPPLLDELLTVGQWPRDAAEAIVQNLKPLVVPERVRSLASDGGEQMSDLYSRAAAFLRGPCILSEPGASLTRLIARYAAGEPWDDPELRNLLSLRLVTAQCGAAEEEGDARIFYGRAAALLQEIQTAVSANLVSDPRD
jgi:hypothetical protein